MKQKSNRLWVHGLCLILVLGLAVRTADALNIVLTFDSGASDSPSFDSNGSKIQAIMQEAANRWGDIIEDTWTLNINFYYDNLSDARGTLASHLNLATSSGKPTSAQIRFDTTFGGVERDWWFDPTPSNHSEFNLTQTLYRDLTGTQQSNWFSGSPPELMEVGYRGAAVLGGAADGHLDIFSSAIHEIGHAVGLTTDVASDEYADGDYDVPSVLVFGTNTNILGNVHVAARTALMCSGCGAASLRRMPTATDVFAVATASGWTKIDLPRQDFWGGSDWNTPFNWEGNQIPLSADDAFVRHGDDASLSAGAHVENLTVDGGSIVFTGGNKLDIDSIVTVGTGNGFAGISILDAGGELEATTVNINDGASVSVMNGGLVDANKVNIETGGTLQGSGTIDAATGIKNNGTILSLGTLTLTTAAATGMDLDGTTGDGVLSATFGDISVTGALKDPFDGTANIGINFLGSIIGRTLSFSDAWELGNGGVVNFIGDSVDPAIIAGAEATLRGDVNVDGLARFTADQVFQSSVDVTVGSGDKLQLNGNTTYEGGDFIGNGTIVQNGDATVTADTAIGVATYNWDGGGSSTTLISGATFTINSSKIDTASASSDGYDGEVTVFGGTLAVNTDASWRLDGTMTLVGGTVQGQDMILYGDLTASPFFVGTTNTVAADVEFKSTSTVSVGADCTLNLNGQTTYAGGAVIGNGKLVQNGNATVSTSTTIFTATFDWDGSTDTSSTTINPGVTLTINSSKIDSGAPSTDGFDGTINLGSGASLAVNTPSPWRMEGTLNMTNTGATPTVSGSQMVVDGTIAVAGGLVYINSAIEFESGTIVTVPTGAELELNGTTTFGGGSYTGDGTIQQDGAATVDAATTIAVRQYDMDGTRGTTTTTINDHLTLNVNYIDLVSNIFNGTLNINNPGRLIVNTPSAWTMAGTMNLDQSGQPNQFYVTGSDVNITGQVNVTGQTAIGAKLNLSGTITLGDAGDFIQLGSGKANIISGGNIIGPGTVASVGGSLTGRGTISADVNFLNSADLLADGGTLTVSGTIVDVGVIGTNSTTGKLDVTGAWNTNLADQLQLNGGEVTGGFITNDGATTGYGTITASGFRNNGTLTASGGTLVLSSISFPDLDGGGSENGVINTGGDTVHVTGNPGDMFAFNGTLKVGLGGEFRMDKYGLTISSTSTGGEINLAGGTYVAPQFVQANVLNVSTGMSTIDSDSLFNSGSLNALSSDLQLKGTALIRNGAIFSGSGDLIVAAGATLGIENGISLGVDLVNNGVVDLGSSPGIVEVMGDFTQNIAGLLNIEIAGTDNSNTANPQFDVLHVSGSASLDGTLDISFIGGFAPDYLDSFEIMTYLSSTGVFDFADMPLLTGDLYFELDYGSTSLTLDVVPEPVTLSLLAIGGLALLRQRKK